MNAKPTPQLAYLLLAAGEARRMGMPKQLLVWKGRPLIRRMTEVLLAAAGDAPVCVVLGARAPLISPVIADLPVTIATNELWAEGMASSLRAGLAALRQAHPDIGGLLVAVVDQPGLSEGLLLALREAFARGNKLVACRYGNGAQGVPAVFGAEFFPQLLQLTGADGARRLLRDPRQAVHWIDFPRGHRDIDRPEDWEAWKKVDG